MVTCIQGDGRHPSHDPFGRPFDGSYYPELASVAGSEIMPGGWTAVLEGIQADQEYCKLLFNLTQYYGKKQCCHYCDVIAWTSREPNAGERNSPNDLYTNFALDDQRQNQILCLVFFWCVWCFGFGVKISTKKLQTYT